MQLVEVTNLNKDLFADFLIKNSSSFEQSWTWGEWQKQNNKNVIRYIVLSDNGEVILAGSGIITPLSPLPGQYLHFVYGPVVSKDLSEAATLTTIKFLTQELKNSFAFIRLEPQQSINFTSVAQKSLNTTAGKTIVNDLNNTEEELLAAMHPKTRYNIKLAERKEVRVECVDLKEADSKIIDAVSFLVFLTQARQKYRNHSKEYFGNLLEFLKTQNEIKVILYQAFFETNLLTSSICFDFAGIRHYVFGGSSEINREVMAPYLLHWTTIKDAKKLGLQYYDWGGLETTSGETPGFARFKMGFGGTEVNFSGAWDIVNKPFIYRIYNPLRKLNRKLKHL